jgi:O-antigen/teichoic acid export membrane protein
MSNTDKIVREGLYYSTARYLSEFAFVIRGLVAAKLLGPSAYGLWAMLKTYINMSEYASGGAANAMYRQVPLKKGEQKLDEVYRIQESTFSFGFVVSAIICGISLLASFFIDNPLLLQLAAVIFLARNIHYFLIFRFKSEKRIALVANYELAEAVINTILTVILMFFFGLKGMVVGTLITYCGLVIFMGLRGYLRFRIKMDWEMIRSLLRLGFPIMILALSGFFMYNIDKIAIFFVLGSTMTGYYSLASFFSNIVGYIPLTISTVLIPRMMFDLGKTNDPRALVPYYMKPMGLLSKLMPMGMGALFLIVEDPIAWLLPKYGPAIPVLKILLPGLVFVSMLSVPQNILIALNKQTRLMAMLIGLLFFGLALDLAVLKAGFGIRGVAMVTTATFFSASLIFNLYAMRSLEIRKRHLVAFYLPTLYVALAVGVSMYWENLAIQVAVFAALMVPLLKVTDDQYKVVDQLKRLLAKPSEQKG